MPCPVFYPTRVVDPPLHQSARLPLIDEYEGVCKADAEAHIPDRDHSFRCCNHGYSKGVCSRFPKDIDLSCLRYSVLQGNAEKLEVVCVEEAGYEPRRWYRLEYFVQMAELRGEPGSDCVRAQVLAFCQAYLRLKLNDEH